MHVLAVRPEDGHVAQGVLDDPEAEQPVVELFELRAGEPHHIDLDPAVQAVHQGLQHHFRAVVVAVAGVDEVDAQDADSLLLQVVVVVEHAHVQDEVVGLAVGPELEADAQPPVAFDGALVVDGSHGIGEDEEVGAGPLVGQAGPHQPELVVEHLVEAGFADVAAAGLFAVNLVGVRLVVGRHGLGDGARRGPHLEEVTGYLLAGADLGKSAVNLRVEVDLQGFLVGFEQLAHGKLLFGNNRNGGKGTKIARYVNGPL